MKLHAIEIRTCIFDVNGVLIDSNPANAAAMGMAFTNDPGIRKNIESYYMTLTGIDRGSKIRKVQEKIIKRPFYEGEFDERWKLFRQFGKKAMQNAELSKGALEILEALKSKNVTRAALSNTPIRELTEVLLAKGLLPYIDIARGGGDWPKSESMKRLLAELNADPGKSLFIGDGKGDLKAARNNGTAFAAIDPDTGEFDGESGFFGPYRNLKEWWKAAL